MSRKRAFQVDFILSVTIREVEKELKFDGRVEGLPKPLRFQLTFAVPITSFETTVKIGEALGINSKIIADAVCRDFAGQYSLEVTRDDGQSLGAVADEVASLVFQSIILAVSLLHDRQVKYGDTEATFRVPLLAAEEMGQFHHPNDLLEFVRSLNR